MLHVDVNIDDFSQDLVRQAIKDGKPALREVATSTAKIIRSTFRLQGKRGDNPLWRRTSLPALFMRRTFPRVGQYANRKAYEAFRDNFRSKAKTLIDTGKLMHSISVLDEKTSNDSVTIWVGSGLSYAKIHETGGNTQLRNRAIVVPPRPSHYLTENDLPEMENAFEKSVR